MVWGFASRRRAIEELLHYGFWTVELRDRRNGALHSTTRFASEDAMRDYLRDLDQAPAGAPRLTWRVIGPDGLVHPFPPQGLPG